MQPKYEIKNLQERLLKETEATRRALVDNSKLEKELKAIRVVNDTAAALREEIYGMKVATPNPPDFCFKPSPAHLPGVPMTMWSDWHWGERVEGSQVGGANIFNRAVAKERVKRLVQITLDLCFKHMVHPKYPGIVVALGGDMISGNIHEELKETNEGPLQVTLLEVQEHLIAALKTMADHFGKVFVPCVVGNHGRTTLKPRAKNRVFESYEWNLYHQLRLHFESDKRFVFHIPDEADAYFSVLGHRFLLTHGDTLGVKGGDGIIGAIGPIARGTKKVKFANGAISRDFDTLLIGHWHSYMPRGDLSPVLVNGALKGFDEYAHLMLRVPYTRPSQSLWFMHQKHGFTAQWPIYLDGKRKSIDSAEWVTWEKRK